MKPLSETTHYELLEVEPEADLAEIERAYRLARATYGSDGIATYSLLDPEDAAALLERIETAWRVLSDPERRRAYDAELRGADADAAFAEPPPELLALEPEPERRRPEVAPSIPAFDRLEDDQEGSWDGPRLRRARLERGIDIEQISKVTKIGAAYLRFLEEEQFADLPAAVYVRGFATAYARCVGLDPERVVPDLMERYAGRQTPAPRRGGARRP